MSGAPDLTWIKQPSEKLLAAKPEPQIGPVVMRMEQPTDAPQIRDLLEASFPGHGEALLVDRLRSAGDIVLSLVAEDGGIVIGYIAFARITVEGDAAPFSAVALAPLAVYSDYQSQGVATQLVREGHACLAFLGETLSVVLGEPQYYGRFGYSNRRVAGFENEYQSPYLMGLSFGAAPWEGRLVYPPAFGALSEDAPLQAHD
jgi:putative acetyltransferase